MACHMPAIETEGVPGAYVHAHTFKVIAPQMTEQGPGSEPVHVMSQPTRPRMGHTSDARLARHVAMAGRMVNR